MTKFHGDSTRFETVAQVIWETYDQKIHYIADVAGGQGMLSRILNKKYNYESEVIDPRTYQLRGVDARAEEYTSDMADYYDLVIGLHPDQATRPVVESALVRPIFVVPCCNFWDRSRKLGRDALVDEICEYLNENDIKYKKLELPLTTPYRIAVYTLPR